MAQLLVECLPSRPVVVAELNKQNTSHHELSDASFSELQIQFQIGLLKDTSHYVDAKRNDKHVEAKRKHAMHQR